MGLGHIQKIIGQRSGSLTSFAGVRLLRILNVESDSRKLRDQVSPNLIGEFGKVWLSKKEFNAPIAEVRRRKPPSYPRAIFIPVDRVFGESSDRSFAVACSFLTVQITVIEDTIFCLLDVIFSQ